MLRTLGDSIAGAMDFTAKNGKTYKVRRLILADMAEFEGWLEGRAYGTVQKLQGKVTPEVLAEVATKVSNQIASGMYTFGGKACNEALQTLPGLTKLVSISCRIPEAEAGELMVTDHQEIGRILQLMTNRSMPEVEESPEGNRAAG